jgi:hypothetical protein
VQLVLDPITLGPPAPTEVAKWTRRMKELGDLIGQGGLRVTCPAELRHAMHAKWFEDGPPSDLIRVFSEVDGRLYEKVDIQGGAVLLDRPSSDPTYIVAEFSDAQRRQFAEHLGEAGAARSEQNDQVGVLSSATSWSEEQSAIRVEADVVECDGLSGLTASGNDGGRLREFLPRSSEVCDVIGRCAEKSCELIMKPKWGISVVWVGLLGGQEEELSFEIGDDFVDSVSALDYRHKPGLAAACLRAMALIAGGRSAEVDGHETRKKGRGSDVLRVDGHAVMRSRIENRRPDANRLHWIRGPQPRFLNVSGHEGGPAL